MSIKFAYRSDSFNSFVCGSNKEGYAAPYTGPNVPTIENGSAIGGKYLRLGTGADTVTTLTFPIRKSLPSSGRQMTILHRLQVDTSAGISGLWVLGGLLFNPFSGYMSCDYYGAGLRVVWGSNGNPFFNDATVPGAFSGGLGTWYDLMLVWDGAIGSLKVCINGSLSVSLTCDPWENPFDWNKFMTLTLGATNAIYKTISRTNEFVIWDTALSGAEISALGLGSSRAAFIPCNQFEGDLSSDPGISSVNFGTSYAVNGTFYTGVAYIPAPGNVRLGTPIAETTGTLALPARSDVRKDVVYDDGESTGLLVVPAESDVLAGVAFDNGSVGTLNPVSITNTITQLSAVPFGIAVTNGVATITKGDTVTLSFKLMADASTAYDLTGATLSARFLNEDGTESTVTDGFTVADQTTNKGECSMTLQNEVSILLKAQAKGSFFVTATLAGEPLQFKGSKCLTVLTNVLS